MTDDDFIRTYLSSAKTICLALVICSIVAWCAWFSALGPITTNREFATVLISSFLSLVLLLIFPNMPRPLIVALWFACISNTLAQSLILTLKLAAHEIKFEPFIAYKLVAFGIAIIAPRPKQLASAVIVACGVIPPIAFYGLTNSAMRPHLLAPEPWTSTLYAVLAFILFTYRNRELNKTVDLVRVASQRDAAQKRAEAYMIMSDLANSPLQAITFAAALIRKNHPEAISQVDSIDRGLGKLKELSEYIAKSETASRTKQD